MSCYRLFVIEFCEKENALRYKLKDAIKSSLNEYTFAVGERKYCVGDMFECVSEVTSEDLLSNDLNFAVVICNGELTSYDDKQIEKLLGAGIPILPVFFKGNKAEEVIPKCLQYINALEVDSADAVSKINGYVLDNLFLKKGSRKIFISYKRDESQAIADQLHDTLIRYGYDVFLDTVSIKKGDDFQKELKHRMADSDVVLLLNTSSYLCSEWTEQELQSAQAAKIGILHLDWPDAHIPKELINVMNMISSVKLNEEDFDISNACKFSCPKSKLKDSVIGLIVGAIEDLRIRNIAARRIMMVNEFCEYQRFCNFSAEYSSYGNLIKVSNSRYSKLYYPITGIPDSHIFDSLRNNPINKTDTLSILYNPLLIRDDWLDYLDWLNIHLPIHTEGFMGVKKEAR